MIRLPASLSALSLALLLAACATESMTGSDPSDSKPRPGISVGSGAEGPAATTDVAAGADQGGAADGSNAVVAAEPGSGPDADVPGSDVAVPGADASTPGSDASVPGSDASVPGSDAAVPGNDATVPGSDVATPGDVPADPGAADGQAGGTGKTPDAVPAEPQPGAAALAAASALQGGWQRASHAIVPALVVDGVPVTDLLQQDDASTRDNLTFFKAGGLWTEDEGAMKPATGGSQSENGAWSLNAAGDILSLYPAGTAEGGKSFDFRLVELTPTTLKLSAASGEYSDHQAHTETIVFTRR